MMSLKSKRIFRTIGAVLLLAVGIGAIVEEVAFRSSSERTTATVKEWRSERLFGMRGTATVDLDVKSAPTLFKNRRVRTVLWYRPGPGDDIEVYRGSGSYAVRLASLWQGYLMDLFVVLGSIVWLVEIWGKRGQEDPSPTGT